MSKMADLDIVLSAHKLSDAQKNAVVELLSPESGEITAKANTLKSLERKGLVNSYAGGGWQLSDQFRAELNLKTRGEESVEKEAEGTEFNKFDATWSDTVKDLAGFGETLKWKNTSVWDGLTAQEIREDMETALPIGRSARRERGRMVRKLTKSLELVGA